MSGHPPILRLPAPEQLPPAARGVATVFGVIALVGLAFSGLGAFLDPAQFAYSWFFAFYFFLTIALGSFFWVTLHYACDSDWSVLPRRVWEHTLGLFPVLLVLFLPLLLVPSLGATLWHWQRPASGPLIHELGIEAWLNRPRFIAFAVIVYFGFFSVAGWYYRWASIAQDRDGNPLHTVRMHDWSYGALVGFGVLETFLSFDWLMGLDWRWSSSLFGVYNFALSVQAALAAGIVLIALLRRAGRLLILTEEHFFLMGKLLFAFTIFYGYIAFGQYLLIWYANIPEESIFYNEHNRGNWVLLSYLIVVGKFMFPTFYLLAQGTKKNLSLLTFIAAWLLALHGVELYWYIGNYAHRATVLPSWQDFASWITFAAILGWGWLYLAGKASLFPTKDPRLVESLTVRN